MHNVETPVYDLIHNNEILKSISIYIVFITVVSTVSTFFKWYYSRKFKIRPGKKNNVHYGIENIANLLKGLGVFVTFLGMLGVDLVSLITSLSIVAAAIAIITKEYIVDFLSGIHLSFSNAFEVGDYVKIDHQKGKITAIKMLKTIILNDDEDVVIIPNAKVHYNEIINYTKRDARFMNVDFQIALKYIASLEELENELAQAISSFKEYIEPKSYNLKVVDIKMEYLDLKFQYTLINNDMDIQRQIRRKTMRELFNFISRRSNGLDDTK